MRPRSLIETLRTRGAERADRLAFVFLDSNGDEVAELSAGELDLRARSVAAALASRGASGKRALLLFPPGLDFVVAFLGCLRAGVVAVPAYPPRPRRSQPRLQAIARDARARFILAPSAIVDGAGHLCASVTELRDSVWLAIEDISSGGYAWEGPDPEPDAPAFLQYTSGSTSEPKGVIVTHANLVHNEEAIRLGFGQTEDSIVAGWLPLYHDMGLIGNVLQPLYTGATAVLLSPLAFLQRPRIWLETIDRYRATTSGGPNFAYDLCVRKIGEAERTGLDLSSWRVAFNGAEPVHAETLERFSAAFASCGFRKEAFFPCYGLAESTLFVAGGNPAGPPVLRSFRAEDLADHRAVEAEPGEGGVRPLVGCGRPSAGQRIVVVDPGSDAPCQPGTIGEIWIAGPSVAAGYWGRPEDSERLFGARTADGDGPFLRTGDLGFLAADGELFVTGRLKDLIILRGRNHYPQDIERTATRVDPLLKADGGAAFSIERDGEERLVVVQEVERGRVEHADLGTLAEAVRRAVADEHEIAVEEVVLLRSGTLPKTTSGKVRRQACRAEYLAGTLAILSRSGLAADKDLLEDSPGRFDEIGGLDPAARASAVQKLVTAEASRVLRLDGGRLEPDRPLTELGLDSLAAVELKTGLEEKTGVPLSLTGLLSGISLASVAAEVLARWAEPRPTAEPEPEIGAPLGEHPLSAGQEALWFSDRLAPEAAAYNVAAAVRVEGRLDPEALRRSLQALADRHPALRTTFSFRAGEPRQIVHEYLAVDFRIEPSASIEADVPLDAEAWLPFDLEKGPLFRVRLWPLKDGDGLLLLAMHHLVTDFWSLGLFVRELGALYGKEIGQAEARLAPLPAVYTDYVRWQARLLSGEKGERLWEHWRRELAGDLPVLELAAGRARPAAQTYVGISRGLRLDPELSDRLRALGAGSGATLFVTLLTGFQALLVRYTGQEEAVIGTPTAGRDTSAFLGVLGYFVNPVALRLDAAGDPTWRELLISARTVSLAAFEHRDLPFAVIAARLHPERAPGRSPIFQTLFALQKAQRQEERSLAELALGEGGARISLADLQLVSVPLTECRSLFDLSLTVADAGEGLPVSLQASRDVLDGATVERMLRSFESLLVALVEDPDSRASAAQFLGEAERQQLIIWNRTTFDLPRGLCLPDLFASQVERTPEREALVAGTERLTYRELDRQVDCLAWRLRTLGVGAESRVGIFSGRSADLVVALLAVLRAGGAYVPLDPNQPTERLAWMLADSEAEVLLAEECLTTVLPVSAVPAGCRIVSLNRIAQIPAAEEGRRWQALSVQPENLAYLIYTSGSTGRPKGVAIEHRSAVTFVQWARRVFTDAELCGVLAATSIGFDLSVFELFVPLSWGGRVILSENALAFPGLSAAGEVRLLNTVPSVLAELMRGEDGLELPASVVTINVAGEPLPRALVRAIHEKHPAIRVLNLYGPSEDTTYSTFSVVAPEGELAPAIGRPIANTQAHVLDRTMRQVPVGARGELYLGGEGLARGYHGRPDLTADRFVPDPFARGARLYRTGDLARWRPEGELEFLGRLDHQVKIRGVRIEPAEVEAALLSRPGVREAAVLPQGEGRDRRLIAFVVAEDGVEESALRGALLGLLPRAMVPAMIMRLSSLPLTPNGKLDRRALAGLAPQLSSGGEGEHEAPRSPVEELLAGLWAEALGVEAVGTGDDFFALGGHSLLALRVQARLRDRLGAELPLSEFFQYPRLADQARRLAVRRADDRPPLHPSPRERTVFPLSFAQAGLWLLERLQPGTAVYHMAGAARLTGPLEVPALAWALGEVVRRHDALHAHFREENGAPVQEIALSAALSVELPLVCLAGLDPARREAEAERLSRTEARRPFDLLAGEPLIRPLLLLLEPRSHDLLLTLHHIAADEDSLTILAREIATLYDARRSGSGGVLPELPLRSVDFALWQRERWQGEALDRELAWWRAELAGLPDVEIPTDRPRPMVRSLEGDLALTVLPPALVSSLALLARREGGTLFMVLLAAFQALLERTSGKPEVPVGCPVSSRDREPLLPLVGFFVNTLVLRASGSADPSFSSLLRRVREATVQAYEHDVPFELLVQALRPDRGVGRNPFFEVVFALQRPPRGWRLGDLAFAPRILSTGTAKFDLTLFGVEEEGGLSLVLEYATDLFDRSTAVRLLGRLETLLAAVAAEPARPLADQLPVLSPAEQEQISRIERLGRPGVASTPADTGEPADEAERLIAEIWQEALKVEQVSRTDNFFALGGHSLLLLPIQERVRERFGVYVPILDLFKYPTAGALARHLQEMQAKALPVEPERPASIVPCPAEAGDPPVSFSQGQLWFIDRLEPGSPVYNLPTAVRLDGILDRLALRHALARLVARQAVLRTTLGSVEGRPIQVVAPQLIPPLPEIDLAALEPAVRDVMAARLVAAEALLPFDLAAGPLFRATLLRLEDDRHLLPVTFHHSITDGWSLRVFYEELGALYAAAITGQEAELPTLPIQYTDFASWQRERLRGEVLERLTAYWRQRLAGAPAALDLPFDRPRPPVQTYDGTSQLLQISAEDTQALRTFTRDESATLFMTLIAAWATLVHRLTGEQDVVLGTPTANRSHPELEPLLGFFANTMPLRIDLSGDPTFRDLVGRVRTAALADYAHQEMPFEKIVEELKPERDLSHHPIYQVVFALETSTRPDRLDLPGLRMTPLPPTEGTAKFDLALYMDDRGGRLGGLLEANRDLVDRSTAACWLDHFMAFATAGVRDSARRLSELPFLSEEARLELLGRIGGRVKIRGYGIEIRFIEAALAAHSAVDSAVVIPRADRPGEERLVAYLTVRPGGSSPGKEELRTFLGERLPEYMLPGAFVRLDALPRAPAGTIDLGALPTPQERAYPGDMPMLPSDGAGRIVVEIWQELLGVEQVDLRDNFFALGGHSLLLLPLQERLRERCGVSLAVIELFKFPTAGALAAHIAARESTKVPRPAEVSVRGEALRQGRERLKQRAERSARKAEAR